MSGNRNSAGLVTTTAIKISSSGASSGSNTSFEGTDHIN